MRRHDIYLASYALEETEQEHSIEYFDNPGQSEATLLRGASRKLRTQSLEKNLTLLNPSFTIGKRDKKGVLIPLETPTKGWPRIVLDYQYFQSTILGF